MENDIKFDSIRNHNFLKVEDKINKIGLLFKKMIKKMIDSHCHLDHEPLFENIDQINKKV